MLELKQEGATIYHRWLSNVQGFNMPIQLDKSEVFIYPTTEWTVLKTKIPLKEIKVKRDYFINVNVLEN